MKLLARAALALAALIAIVLALVDPRSSEADHLCGATGSPYGPFNIETYEAGNYRTLYGETLNLVGTNQLFPSLPSFAIPSLDSGVRGSTTQVSPHIPPVLLKAIASIESNWAQADYSVPYGSVGPVLSSHDCGYGIMQITSGMQNIAGSPNLDQAMIGGHFAFNMARGGHILADKWNMAPEFRPQVGNADPRVIENWYFALWGYNGFAFQNHPLNPAFSPTRVDYSCGPLNDGFGHDRTRYPYQELVYGCAEHPPVRGGQLLWPSQGVHLPDLTDPRFAEPLSVENWSPCSQFLDCAAMDIPTPNTNHTDSTVPTVSRSEVTGTPRMEVSTSGVTIGREGGATVTVSNSGSGVLAYRVRSTSPWIGTSRYQGVSLGSDIGTRTSSFVVSANTAGLAAGTYTGSVVVESLYAANAPRTISVKLINLPSGSLVRGSAPDVYLMQRGLKRHLVSRQNFIARGYSWSDVEVISDQLLESIPTGDPLLDALADGNLLKGTAPDVYVMQGGRKRHAVSQEVFLGCGYWWDAVRKVPDGLLGEIPTGEPLDLSHCPQPSFEDKTLLKGTAPDVYVMKGGEKRHAVAADVFLSCGYKWGNINEIADSTLKAVPDGPSLSACVPDNSLLRGSAPDVYLVQRGLKRHLVSRQNFIALGYSWSDIQDVSDQLLGSIPTGDPLLDALADGNLVKGTAPDVYVMEDGKKRHAVSKEVFLGCGYWWDAVRKVPDGLLEEIPTGEPLDLSHCPQPSFEDNTLLKGTAPDVYVMEGGEKRHAVAADVFLSCGYKWGNINRIADSTIESIPVGAPLSPCP